MQPLQSRFTEFLRRTERLRATTEITGTETSVFQKSWDVVGRAQTSKDQGRPDLLFLDVHRLSLEFENGKYTGKRTIRKEESRDIDTSSREIITTLNRPELTLCWAIHVNYPYKHSKTEQ